jgi:hypothetical protein
MDLSKLILLNKMHILQINFLVVAPLNGSCSNVTTNSNSAFPLAAFLSNPTAALIIQR